MSNEHWRRAWEIHYYARLVSTIWVPVTLVAEISVLCRHDLMNDLSGILLQTSFDRPFLSLWAFAVLTPPMLGLWVAYWVARERAMTRDRVLVAWCRDCHQHGSQKQPAWPSSGIAYPVRCEHCDAPRKRVDLVEYHPPVTF